jgi:4-amino-4-deoxy-L-arabinose transferase-like glycosyltransferase
MFAVSALCVRLSWVSFRPWVAGDSYDYVKIARNIRFHHLFSLTESAVGPFLPTASRPPLYPALIALFWIRDSPPIKLVLVVQALMGAATVVLVYLSARDSFDGKVASVAAIFMIIAPMTGYFTAVILTEILFTFLFMLAVFLWGRGLAVLSGVVFGLAALTRPTILPFLLIVPAISFLPSFRSAWRKHLLILLVAVAISSTWIVRNVVVFHRFIAIMSTGWGPNLLCGTMDTELLGIKVWTGSEWAVVDVNTHPLLQVDPGISESDKERILLRRGLLRIKERPLHWIVVRVEQYPKLFLDSGDYVLGRYNVSIRDAVARRNYGVLLFKFLFLSGNLAALALAGWGFYLVRRRWRELLHLISFPVFLLVAQIPMWTESRYTIPIVPVIAIFASVGLQALWRTRGLARGHKSSMAASRGN